ncbi:MAG TPA: response regulator [Polyangia bacterium]|jgi:CheY-like chemotaxis protein|nr:response regulator [Polyangia bacterium]
MLGEVMNLGSDRRSLPLTVGEAPFDVAEGPRLAPWRILLVEDDDAIRVSLAEGLRESGLKVALAENGRQALELLRSEPHPSAIVLDLMLPVMDGWDFRHEQLRDPALRDIPVVIITATGFTAKTIRTQLGDVEVLAKPIRQAELLDVLNRACVRH